MNEILLSEIGKLDLLIQRDTVYEVEENARMRLDALVCLRGQLVMRQVRYASKLHKSKSEQYAKLYR